MLKASTIALCATVIALSSSMAFARRGADDPAGHIRGEGAGHASLLIEGQQLLARNGADDAAGHMKGEGTGHAARENNEPRGEGKGHASIAKYNPLMQQARNGADDAPGDQRGRGNDGVGHA
jgi:hypothetical protein